MTPDPSSQGSRPDLEEAVEVWESMNDVSILKSVAAVILGFVALTLGSVLAGRLLIAGTGVEPGDPVTTGFIGASIASRLVVAIFAGYLTARAAPRAPRLHALVLAGVLAFFSLSAVAGLTSAGGLEDPTWYPIAMSFVGPIGVALGGVLRRG